ncbi:hypothetical protein PMAYCL1PPCAC_15218, partial [Pristionchus mayeri]
LVKGEIGFDDEQYSSIFIRGDESAVRRSLNIPERRAKTDAGFNIRTLAGSILGVFELQGWKMLEDNRPDGVYNVPFSVGFILNRLEPQGWKLESVTGPDFDDGTFTFTLRKKVDQRGLRSQLSQQSGE